MPQLKTGPKILLIALGALLFVFGLRTAAERGWIPTPGIMKALVPNKAVLPDVKDAAVTGVEPAALPSRDPASVSATPIRGEIWEWNAQANLIYANGGASTTKGSLMEKHGVNLSLIRQDDTTQMQNDLVTCAKELHEGASQCSTGANFVVIMGDGAGQFLAAVNPILKKLGPEYVAKAIGATGYSRGEDAFMTPPEMKHDPKSFSTAVMKDSEGKEQPTHGLLVSGVLRDGDWNIAQKWEGDNNIPNNPDEKTFDPDAINWVNAADYLKAAEAYNAGQCEDRKEVTNGHPAGKTVHVCVNAVVTWTPGDVNIAKGKGGLIKVVSSKQYRSQMPATIIGPEAFFQKNRPEIEGMLAATFEAGDQMKAFPQALEEAAKISAHVYNDQDKEYWLKYFRGVTETDAQGLKVDLGGSAVNNLQDEKTLFGMNAGSNDNFRSTYSTFAAIDMQQYPSLFKDTPIPTAQEIEDKSFISGAESVMNSAGSEADTPNYKAEEGAATVSKRAYHINFTTNSAQLTPDGEETMKELRDSLAITGLFIRVDGFTDDQGAGLVGRGGVSVNQALSEARANAVKNWLQKHAPTNFPDSRFAVAGHGDSRPVASNTTAEGRAQNRRVEITLQGN